MIKAGKKTLFIEEEDKDECHRGMIVMAKKAKEYAIERNDSNGEEVLIYAY